MRHYINQKRLVMHYQYPEHPNAPRGRKIMIENNIIPIQSK